MCLVLFALSHFALSVPMKIIISGVHFTAAKVIRRSVSCTLRVTLSHFHIIFIGFHPVINAIIITYVIKQYHCTNTFGILCITSVQAIHNCRSAPVTQRSRCISQKRIVKYSQTNAFRNMKPTPRASIEQHRQLLRSTSAHLSHIQRNKTVKSHVYLRDTRRTTES